MNISFRQKFTRNLLSIPGWHTQRKIVVIESDDWGSIRMASKNAYNDFLKHNYPVDQCPYNSNDALESNEDMEFLFEALSSVKDIHGNPAVLTANNIVANPDFDKIRASGFQQYYYEPFTKTLQRYPQHNRVENLYRKGIEKKLVVPQFHGREHVNTQRWLKALQDGDKATHLAFDYSMFSVHAEKKPVMVNELMDALDGDSAAALNEKFGIVQEGLQLFKTTWGFHSKSFIAPCYIWSTALEPLLANNQVKYIQGMVLQLEPTAALGYQYKKKYHFQGQQNQLRQRYLIRNAFFEPSANPRFDWLGDCLNRIETAFRWHKPAIVSAHRVNFIGFLNPGNRDSNLQLLVRLLKLIQQRWPGVEFMSSDQLGDLMNKNND